VEEMGFMGGIALFALLMMICSYGYYIAFHCKHKFGYLLALGLMINFCLYIFINIGMVMGLLPVVGAPLPLVSYGGTSMLAAMISFGLMMSVWIHRERTMPRTDMD
jgi:rod shape determining protein RodA